MLNKLTVVLITYNRHNYLERTIDYWKDINVNLLILDGSKESYNINYLSKTIKAKINYIHHPHSLNSRLKYVLGLIKTEYVLLASDDEYFLPSGINDCINYLEKNPDYISCIGRTIAFNININKLVYWPEYVDMEGYEVDSNNPFMRMYSHMGEYTCNTIFSVVRAEKWKVAINVITSYNFNVYSIQEYQFENIISFFGKSKVINSLMWLRNQENPSLYNNTQIELFYKWWKLKKYKSQRHVFIETQVKHISDYIECNHEKLRNAIILSYNIFSNWYAFNYPIPKFRDDFYNFLVFNFPLKFKKYFFKFRFLYRRFKKTKITKENNIYSYNSIVEYLNFNNITFSSNELSNSIFSLKKFHKIND
jgi:glycosyltransferase domain-containing protein